jgi:hypothetical protein
VRVAVLHHVTWSINSICHMVGDRPFTAQGKATNFWPLAILSMGESWHNLHHADPTCARHGGRPGEIDITARVIWALERLGWAHHMRWPTPQRLARLNPNNYPSPPEPTPARTLTNLILDARRPQRVPPARPPEDRSGGFHSERGRRRPSEAGPEHHQRRPRHAVEQHHLIGGGGLVAAQQLMLHGAHRAPQYHCSPMWRCLSSGGVPSHPCLAGHRPIARPQWA